MLVLNNTFGIVKKAILFTALLIIAIGICGAWVVETKLFANADFWIYGNKGKVLILLPILFPFIIRKKIHLLPTATWRKKYFYYAIYTLLSFVGFFVSTSKLINEIPSKPLIYYLPSHIFLLIIPVFLLLSIFGPRFITQFTRAFKKEIALTMSIGVFLYIAIEQVWNLWPLFSGIVLYAVSTLFSLSFKTSVLLPNTLIVESFSVRVGEECSGLESLFMFSTLYALIGYFEWKTLKKIPYILTFIPLLVGLNIINIIRVYIIVLVGVLWSPDIAVQLFHTYLGMVLFIVYFLLFIRFIFPRLKKPVLKKDQ